VYVPTDRDAHAKHPSKSRPLGMIIHMVAYDPPAAAARRAYVLDRLVEHLIDWGCPLDYAEQRAAILLDTVIAAGWTLPAPILEAPTRRGPGSTPEARAAALAHIRDTLGQRHNAPRGACDAPISAATTTAGIRTSPDTAQAN
jgi:hypothetical protein